MSEISENVKSISDFLGKDGVDEIKRYLIDNIEENIKESVESEFFIGPDDLQDFVGEIFYEVKEELKGTYKRKLKAKMKTELDKYIDSIEIKKGD